MNQLIFFFRTEKISFKVSASKYKASPEGISNPSLKLTVEKLPYLSIWLTSNSEENFDLMSTK